jgi:hypothetical protein
VSIGRPPGPNYAAVVISRYPRFGGDFGCQAAAIGRYLLTLLVLRSFTFIPPFEATLRDRLPKGQDWLHEVNGGALDPVAVPRILAWRHDRAPCADGRIMSGLAFSSDAAEQLMAYRTPEAP